jgi:hypothetical protein
LWPLLSAPKALKIPPNQTRINNTEKIAPE